MANQDIDYDYRNFTRDLKRYEDECHYKQTAHTKVLLHRIKKMAVEIVVSAIADIMSIERIKNQVRILTDEKSTYHKKIVAQMLLSKHVDAVDWICSGEAKKSFWFDILGINFVKKEILMHIVHERVEGRFKQVERSYH